MAIRFENSKPILEIASLIAVFTLAIVGIGVFVTWLPIFANHVAQGSRPYPPSPEESAFAGCQDSAFFSTLGAMLLLSVALRMSWLLYGRGYKWNWAVGRMFFDHVILTFVAGVLIANTGVGYLHQPFAAMLKSRCGSIAAIRAATTRENE